MPAIAKFAISWKDGHFFHPNCKYYLSLKTGGRETKNNRCFDSTVPLSGSHYKSGAHQSKHRQGTPKNKVSRCASIGDSKG